MELTYQRVHSGYGMAVRTPYGCCVALGFSGSGYVGLMPVVLLDNIVLEWSRQGLPAVNEVLAHYSKLAPKMTTPRKGDYPHYRDSQLGEACCIDPLVGQYKASRAGLGNLLRREHIRTALRAVLRYNFQRTLNQHYNYGRTYVTGDEDGVVTGTYPRGGKPSQPFLYQSECWTGPEYAFARLLLDYGFKREALLVVQAIRA